METEVINDNSNSELMPLPAARALEPVDQKQPTTAAQAKVDAVAALTLKAYDRASMLQLTEDEIAKLSAEFPDEAFKPGAAGKENLIYIEHAFLRDRLNSVFRPGQWSIVPRNRWAEDFSFVNKYKETVQASRVYVEAMLIIRGCFVAESVGEMTYYKNNDSQNYGDAVEGAKTAALRRCCKELGVGLQAWKKDWCEGWWERRRNGSRTRQESKPVEPKQDRESRPAQPKTVAAPQAGKPRAEATPEQRIRMVELFEKEGRDAIQSAFAYFIDTGAILPTESLGDIPLRFIPTTQKEMRELGALIASGKAEKPPWMSANEPPMTNCAKAEELPLGESPAITDAAAPSGARILPDGMEEETGVIATVSLKEGKSAKGPWSRWGIKINGEWHNSFDNTIGKAAQGNKGQEATVIYTQTDRGRNIEDMIIGGFSVLKAK